MAMKKKNDKPTEIEVVRVLQGRTRFCVMGTSPLIYNAMSAKVRQELLYPKKKSRAARASTMKHDCFAEFQDSMYIAPSGETLLTFPAVGFKKALADTALDVDTSTSKAQLLRLVWAIGERVHIYGIPELRMDVVRQAGIQKTPDVRTRACLREWCCEVELAYAIPQLNETTVATLLINAGVLRGIGDFRQEKGAGNYGQFTVAEADDETFQRVKAEGGRDAQLQAFEHPSLYDDETVKLYTWWQEEVQKRGHGEQRRSDNGKSVTTNA